TPPRRRRSATGRSRSRRRSSASSRVKCARSRSCWASRSVETEALWHPRVKRSGSGKCRSGSLVQGEQSGGSVAIFEAAVPAGARVPVAHSHDGYEETIYGLEGVLTWTVEGTPSDVT